MNPYFPWPRHDTRTPLLISQIFFSVVFVIVRTRFIRKTILGKFTGKVGNLDVKNTTVVPSIQQENKLNINIFLFIVMFLLVMIEYNFRSVN